MIIKMLSPFVSILILFAGCSDKKEQESTIDKIPVDNTGQGVAWDRFEANIIYSISKKDRQVRVFSI